MASMWGIKGSRLEEAGRLPRFEVHSLKLTAKATENRPFEGNWYSNHPVSGALWCTDFFQSDFEALFFSKAENCMQPDC